MKSRHSHLHVQPISKFPGCTKDITFWTSPAYSLNKFSLRSLNKLSTVRILHFWQPVALPSPLTAQHVRYSA